MMTDKDLGRDLASEHRHEERARAWYGGLEAVRLDELAAQFAEVEAEAKRECATAFAKEQCAPIEARIKELIDGATIPEVELPLPSFQKLKKAYLDSLPDPDPDTSGLPVPKLGLELGNYLGGGVYREPTCTCGAASCGSRIHSDYCDLA